VLINFIDILPAFLKTVQTLVCVFIYAVYHDVVLLHHVPHTLEYRSHFSDHLFDVLHWVKPFVCYFLYVSFLEIILPQVGKSFNPFGFMCGLRKHLCLSFLWIMGLVFLLFRFFKIMAHSYFSFLLIILSTLSLFTKIFWILEPNLKIDFTKYPLLFCKYFALNLSNSK